MSFNFFQKPLVIKTKNKYNVRLKRQHVNERLFQYERIYCIVFNAHFVFLLIEIKKSEICKIQSNLWLIQTIKFQRILVEIIKYVTYTI